METMWDRPYQTLSGKCIDNAIIWIAPMDYCELEVLTPAEIGNWTAEILADAASSEIPPKKHQQLCHELQEFKVRYSEAFSRFGQNFSGELTYRNLIRDFQEQIASQANRWLPESGKGKKGIKVISSMLSRSKPPVTIKVPKGSLARKKLKAQPKDRGDAREHFPCPEFEKPLFIVSAPRAGSTLLFETLSEFPELWTIGCESHETIEGIPELHPSTCNFSSNRLTEANALPHICATLRERFARQLCDRSGRDYLDIPPNQRPRMVRFLEKTPKNALRIPFLKAVFPEALFIYLYRDPKENISSMMEGWRSRRFVAYKNLPGWPFREWSFLLTPGWLSLQNCSIAEIAAEQWKIANFYIWQDLQKFPPSSWCIVRYRDLIREPAKTIRVIREFAGLTWDKQIERVVSQSLPVSRMAMSPPSPDKWRKNEKEIAKILPTVEPIVNLVEKKTMKTVLPKDRTEQASPKKTKTIRELGPVDISSIREEILNLPQEFWQSHNNSKPNKFKKLGRTEHIVFKFVRDYDDHSQTIEYPIWDEWKSKLEPILEAVTKPYGYKDGDFSRIMLAKLPAGCKIALHIDPFESSNYTHKIHIPIQTNPDVEFLVGYKRYHFLEGHAYEVNNKAIHGGVNAGDTDRINLIVEYFEK